MLNMANTISHITNFNSNTTLVNVKCIAVAISFVLFFNSNTTLVNVKLGKDIKILQKKIIQIQHLLMLNLVLNQLVTKSNNSNTTLVNVKSTPAPTKEETTKIQIQHLLMLNFLPRQNTQALYNIQIQHLLMLNKDIFR